MYFSLLICVSVSLATALFPASLQCAVPKAEAEEGSH